MWETFRITNKYKESTKGEKNLQLHQTHVQAIVFRTKNTKGGKMAS